MIICKDSFGRDQLFISSPTSRERVLDPNDLFVMFIIHCFVNSHGHLGKKDLLDKQIFYFGRASFLTLSICKIVYQDSKLLKVAPPARFLVSTLCVMVKDPYGLLNETLNKVEVNLFLRSK